jgi:hypothetical protein
VFGGWLPDRLFSSTSSKSSNPITTPSKTNQQQEQKTFPNNNNSKGNSDDFAVITGSERERELNANLTEMSAGLHRLQGLGLNMQRELDRQDPLLDRLNNRVDATKTRIDSQNSQIKTILKR